MVQAVLAYRNVLFYTVERIFSMHSQPGPILHPLGLIDPLLRSAYFQPGGDGLLIVWWDEGSLSGLNDSCGTNITDNRSSAASCNNGGGRVAVVVAAPDLKSAGYQSPVYFQHPSATRTIAEALGITPPPPAAAATDFGDFF
jgi:hypothetical protein